MGSNSQGNGEDNIIVVLEGCLGDWAKKSYIEDLAKRAEKREIVLYAVDVRDRKKDEEKYDQYRKLVYFVNKVKDKKMYEKIPKADFVFIVTPHEFHCAIADHWLEDERLKATGKIFIEKPLNSSVENIKDLEKKHGKKKLMEKIIAIDHYIPKIAPLLEEIEWKRRKYGKIEKVRINILESDPIQESREKTLDEGLILDIFPHVLAVFTKIMKAVGDFTLDAHKVKIIEIKTGKYKNACIGGETFAKIVLKFNNTTLESFIGKAVGFEDEKTMEIFFEKGYATADFITGNFSLKKENGKSKRGHLQKIPVKVLLDDVINRKEFHKNFLSFDEGFEIVKIISRIRKKTGKPRAYEKFSSVNTILKPKSGDKDTLIDVLLKQYGFLRGEITRCIYLEHLAIIGLYTSLGVVAAALIENITKTGCECTFQIPFLAEKFDLGKTVAFLLVLVFLQVLVSGFGSLFLKEQARNRRACSFLKAIEYIINERVGEVSIYWENYITSHLIAKKSKWRDFFKFEIPVNPQYYKNRFLSVGLPVFLPNLFLTSGILCGSIAVYTDDLNNSVFPVFFVSVILLCSLYITFFWALMILLRTCTSLKEEKVPTREEVLAWIEKENRTL
jgi:predicted dehydrogenase